DRIPPEITPKNEEKAIVMVDNGPAVSIGIFRLSANNVGNQFFVAQPGKLGTAKYNKITQNAILLNNMGIPFQIEVCGPTFFSGLSRAGVSKRVKIKTTAYRIPIKPKIIKVCCQEKREATVAPKPPNA